MLNNYNNKSKVTDHNKYINNESLKYWELPKYDRDMKLLNAVGKMASMYLLYTELPQTFNVSTMQYLQSAIKRNAMKRGRPVYVNHMDLHGIECSINSIYSLLLVILTAVFR